MHNAEAAKDELQEHTHTHTHTHTHRHTHTHTFKIIRMVKTQFMYTQWIIEISQLVES